MSVKKDDEIKDKNVKEPAAKTVKKVKKTVVDKAVATNSESNVGAQQKVSSVKKVSTDSSKNSNKVASGGSTRIKSKTTRSKKQPNTTVYHGVGRRKNAVARCYLTEGKGEITVNGVDYVSFFKNNPLFYYVILLPLRLFGGEKDYNIKVSVNGGGFSAQADAIKLSISICLSKISLENRVTLKSVGYLTTDSRIVERKKPGRKKARKSFQFSKR